MNNDKNLLTKNINDISKKLDLMTHNMVGQNQLLKEAVKKSFKLKQLSDKNLEYRSQLRHGIHHDKALNNKIHSQQYQIQNSFRHQKFELNHLTRRMNNKNIYHKKPKKKLWIILCGGLGALGLLLFVGNILWILFIVR